VNYKMEHCTKDSGYRARMLEMEEVFKSGQMDQDMTDFGRMEWLMDVGD
jgi:hypothetical protein